MNQRDLTYYQIKSQPIVNRTLQGRLQLILRSHISVCMLIKKAEKETTFLQSKEHIKWSYKNFQTFLPKVRYCEVRGKVSHGTSYRIFSSCERHLVSGVSCCILSYAIKICSINERRHTTSQYLYYGQGTVKILISKRGMYLNRDSYVITNLRSKKCDNLQPYNWSSYNPNTISMLQRKIKIVIYTY